MRVLTNSHRIEELGIIVVLLAELVPRVLSAAECMGYPGDTAKFASATTRTSVGEPPKVTKGCVFTPHQNGVSTINSGQKGPAKLKFQACVCVCPCGAHFLTLAKVYISLKKKIF